MQFNPCESKQRPSGLSLGLLCTVHRAGSMPCRHAHVHAFIDKQMLAHVIWQERTTTHTHTHSHAHIHTLGIAEYAKIYMHRYTMSWMCVAERRAKCILWSHRVYRWGACVAAWTEDEPTSLAKKRERQWEHTALLCHTRAVTQAQKQTIFLRKCCEALDTAFLLLRRQQPES